MKAAMWSMPRSREGQGDCSPDQGLGRGGGTSEGAAGRSDAVGVCCEVTCIGGSWLVSSRRLCEVLVPVRGSTEEESLRGWGQKRGRAEASACGCWRQHVRT